MIAILLCTYNGERYIKEQLDSLIVQTNQDFIVYIHDDGSTDRTMTIIDEYCISYPHRFVKISDHIKHRGAGKSFMWLLDNIIADYYMFCDQDDVWLPRKVETTMNHMLNVEQTYPGKPVLIHTDLKLTDENLNITYDSFWRFQNFKVDISKRKEYIGFGNIVTGCTMMINKEAKRIAFPYNGKLLHDYWLALQVAKFGIVDNIKEQTMLYRQHGTNEAGAGSLYKKNHIGYKKFFREIREEQIRVKDVSGANLYKWFMYRVIYFFHRHF